MNVVINNAWKSTLVSRIAKNVREVTGRGPRMVWSAGASMVAPCCVSRAVASANVRYTSVIVPLSRTSAFMTTRTAVAMPKRPNTSAMRSKPAAVRSEYEVEVCGVGGRKSSAQQVRLTAFQAS